MFEVGMKDPRIGVVKTIGAVVALVAAAALAPASAAAQSQSDTTASAKASAKVSAKRGTGVMVIQVSPSDSTVQVVEAKGQADTTHVHADSAGKSVIRITPQGGQGGEIIVQMQGQDGKPGTMGGTFKIQMQSQVQDQGQPKIKTEGSAADTTAGKSAPAAKDSTKAPAR
jgi:hypothetical protein